MSAKDGFRRISRELYAIRQEVLDLTPRQRRQMLRKVEKFNSTNCGFVELWAKEFLTKCITEAKWDDKINRKSQAGRVASK